MRYVLLILVLSALVGWAEYALGVQPYVGPLGFGCGLALLLVEIFD